MISNLAMPRPPEVRPPTWALKETSVVLRPIRAAWIAAMEPAEVPPKTTTSLSNAEGPRSSTGR
jgi:hypothetical protein